MRTEVLFDKAVHRKMTFVELFSMLSKVAGLQPVLLLTPSHIFSEFPPRQFIFFQQPDCNLSVKK